MVCALHFERKMYICLNCLSILIAGCKMSNYFGDEPFTSEEDLFFEKLFGEDELSQRKTSKTTSKTRYVIFIFILMCMGFFLPKDNKVREQIT